jgi:hypothetical protein
MMTSGDRTILQALEKHPHALTETELLTQILERLERLNDRFDDFAGVFLNAKFPYGKATDRWGRR